NASDVIWTMKMDGKFTYVSPSVFQMRGFTPEEAIQQPLEQAICPGSLAAVQEVLSNALAEIEAVHPRPTKYFEIEQPCRDGATVWTEATARLVYDEAGQPLELVGVSRNITDRKRLQKKLQQQATTDELTGISNRHHFLELAHSELKRAIRLKHPLAIVLLDIDHFKQINDTYGHATGDRVLVAFTKVCLKKIREIDVFARFGGDEFVLLLPETNNTHAYDAMERVRLGLTAQPIDFDGRPVSITISAGVSGLKSDQETFDALLSRADQALYRAKEGGRNRVMVEHADECQPLGLLRG
ncbi:MAG: GGDEF domain-containing protein, partial [Deltaproteobacteria bacterium]|nr:GGDEF domain-containing protein [Deltaproteobacteria bacterium]